MSANQKLVPTSNLVKEIQTRELERKALDALEECLEAESMMFDKSSGCVEKIADGKTRLGAAQTILAYSAGKPIERKEIISSNADSIESVMKRIQTSPELRKAMREVLDQTEKSVIDVTKS